MTENPSTALPLRQLPTLDHSIRSEHVSKRFFFFSLFLPSPPNACPLTTSVFSSLKLLAAKPFPKASPSIAAVAPHSSPSSRLQSIPLLLHRNCNPPGYLTQNHTIQDGLYHLIFKAFISIKTSNLIEVTLQAVCDEYHCFQKVRVNKLFVHFALEVAPKWPPPSLRYLAFAIIRLAYILRNASLFVRKTHT